MIIKNVRGGYDFLPKEQNIRNYINNTLKNIFERYGYNSIETPILCYYDILADKYDDDNDILNLQQNPLFLFVISYFFHSFL